VFKDSNRKLHDLVDALDGTRRALLPDPAR
jgi:hypothetical protein